MSTVGAMSFTLPTIFSLEKSRKWIIREGLNGISRIGSGAPIASAFRNRGGFAKACLLFVVSIDATDRARDPMASSAGFATRNQES